MADSSVFFTSRAMRLREKLRSASALSTFLPRISWASRFSFCGLTRRSLVTALASLSASVRSRAALPITLSSSSPCGPRRRELAEFVADHVLGDQHRNMLMAVMHAEGEPDELRQDRLSSRSYVDHRVRA